MVRQAHHPRPEPAEGLSRFQRKQLSRKCLQCLVISNGLGRSKLVICEERLLPVEQLRCFLMHNIPSRVPQGRGCQGHGTDTLLYGGCRGKLTRFSFQQQNIKDHKLI